MSMDKRVGIAIATAALVVGVGIGSQLGAVTAQDRISGNICTQFRRANSISLDAERTVTPIGGTARCDMMLYLPAEMLGQ